MTVSISPAPSPSYNQNDLLIWALFLCGGATNWTDVETLYLKAFEIGPASLGWRTRSDIPDYKKCAKALQSVEDPSRSNRFGLIAKRDRYSRMLTPQGIEWCVKYESELLRIYQGSPQFAKNSERGRRVEGLRRSLLFNECVEDGSSRLNLVELSDLFKCSTNTTRANWNKRLSEVTADATLIEDLQVLEFITTVQNFLDEEGIK